MSTRNRLEHWEALFRHRIAAQVSSDPAHDLAHVERVVRMAKNLATIEDADLRVVVPAAWLHDLVMTSKTSRQRALASKRAATAARKFLLCEGYPASLIASIEHAITAHSFSARVDPKTLEAEVVQDADRLDALGAIGIARCFATGAGLRQSFYNVEDPFGKGRRLDDHKYSLDHFEVKLFRIAKTLRTPAHRL